MTAIQEELKIGYIVLYIKMIKLHLLEQRFILMPFLEIYFDVIP
jgi:hypothetical protein